MVSIVQDVVIDGNTSVTSFGGGFPVSPTENNLLILFYGARDADNNETPVFTPPSGWTKVVEASPMEYHSVGIAWRMAPASLGTGNQAMTTASNVNSWWHGMLEVNDAGISAWKVDKFAGNGSGATNVSSIATGSTGTLSSATGFAAIAGTSRTAAEGLSTDTGTSLADLDAVWERDAGAANYIGARQILAATTALNATISESGGASRMGAVIATFIEDAGSTVTPNPTLGLSLGFASPPVAQVTEITKLLGRSVDINFATGVVAIESGV